MLGSNAVSRVYLGASEVWSAMDPDAVAYIAAIESAGASVSAVQKSAIDTFIASEKAGGRWALHKRLYFPIWGVEAANAICMVSLTSGTFAGGVTHGAGFVQGNGSTGYFNMGVSASTLALTTAAGGLSVLITVAHLGSGFRCLVGSSSSPTAENYLASEATGLRFSYNSYGSSLTAILARVDQTGIINSDRSGGFLRVRRRSGSGVTSLLNLARGNAGSVSTGNLVYSALSDTGGYCSNARLGAAGINSGLEATQADEFSLALKTLWETCTGLTLPA